MTFLGGVTKTDSGMPVRFETYRLRVSLAATSCQCPLENLPRASKCRKPSVSGHAIIARVKEYSAIKT